MFEEEFNDYKIVFTQRIGEHIYDEVLDNFHDARYVYISSFGITLETNFGNKLFKKIKNLKNPSVIKVITNIRKEKELEDFKKVLQSDLPANLKFYFNLLNHSKIILTDKMAYIGSENFTEYSGKGTNVEAGIITKDKKAIKYLKKRLDSIIGYSYPTLDFEKYEKRLKLVSSLEKKSNELDISLLAFKRLFEGEQEVKSGVFEKYDYDFSVMEEKEVTLWIHEIRELLNDINGQLKHELQKDEPLYPLNENLLKPEQKPDSKIITETKNKAIKNANFDQLMRDINANIETMDYTTYRQIYENLLEYYDKSNNPESFIEEYGGTLDNFLDEMDNPITKQSSYLKLVEDTHELIQHDINEQEKLYESCKIQINKVEKNLFKAIENLSNLIKTLKGRI